MGTSVSVFSLFFIKKVFSLFDYKKFIKKKKKKQYFHYFVTTHTTFSSFGLLKSFFGEIRGFI